MSIDGKRVAQGGDFDASGVLKKADVVRLDLTAAQALVDSLTGAGLTVSSVDNRPGTRKPAAPFMTSTLQREASNKLRWGAQRTMRVAQACTNAASSPICVLTPRPFRFRHQRRPRLAAGPYTAVTTSSRRRAATSARSRMRRKRTGDPSIRRRVPDPGGSCGPLTGDDFALYDLIWKRTVASQMA